MLRFDQWRRRTLLAIAIAFLLIGLILNYNADAADEEFLPGVLLKVGMVLFMTWLALPQLQRLNPWFLVPIALLALIAIIQPRTLPILARGAVPLLPVFFLIWLFWVPKRGRS